MHRVHTSASVSERKFAEKLTILVERGRGILTRVYNIKKVSVWVVCDGSVVYLVGTLRCEW